MARGEQRIARIGALEHSPDHKAWWQLGRHILHRVHGKIGPPLRDRDFQLLDEQSFAADRGETAILDLIAPGAHRHEFDLELRMGAAQQGGDMPCLPQGQLALAGRNSQHAALGHELWNSCDFSR